MASQKAGIMKTPLHIEKIFLYASFFILLGSQQSLGQQSYSGNWTGMFMDDFKTVIQLEWSDDSGFTGYIMMYNGSEQIQDDALSRIAVEENKLTFYIQAKETSFEGTFNEEINELSGKFTFPDGSRHPLVTRKDPPTGPEAT